MTLENASESVKQAAEQGRKAAQKASDAVKEGYETAQDYAKKGYQAAQDYVGDPDMLKESLRDLVREQPWLALGLAFGIGFLAARIIRRAA